MDKPPREICLIGTTGAKLPLHPLIYTRLEFTLAHDMVVCRLELLSGYDNEVGFVNRGRRI